jgi:hypothetical protein
MAKVVKEKVSFLLPKGLTKRVRRAAADAGCWPARIVTAALEGHLRERAGRPDTGKRTGANRQVTGAS